MIIIPIDAQKHVHLVVILGPENISRLEDADPINFSVSQVLDFSAIEVKPIRGVMIAYHQDPEALCARFQHDGLKLVEYLSRNRQTLPQDSEPLRWMALKV